MRNRNLIYLILSLGITSGMMLIDRFITPIADWLGITLLILATIFLTRFIVRIRRSKK